MPYRLSVKTVTSGQGAIDLVKAGEVYDIIFMDYMMPEMDGVEAMEKLHELGYSQPIIALTANTVNGAAELFKGKGFAEFISKPIDCHLLNKCLHRFIKDKQPPEVIEMARKEMYEKITPILDVSISENLSEVFIMDLEKSLSVFESFSADWEMNDKELKSFVIQAHAMKSALRNVGRTGLSEVAYTLEKAGKDYDMATIKVVAPHFVDNLKKLKIELTQEVDEPNDGDLEFLATQLGIIATACKSYDVDTANNTLNTIVKSRYAKEVRDIISDISTNLLYSKYELVAETINAFLTNADSGS